MKSMEGVTRTFDSRYLHRNNIAGEFFLYNMYSRNIRVEGDGIGYNELNVLRALLLEPVLYVAMRCNLLLYYNEYNIGNIKAYFVLSHILGFIFNLLRIVINVSILIIEVIAWPVRIIIGTVLAPIAILISAGHIYALPYKVIHELLLDAGPIVVRHITVSRLPVSPKCVLNAGALGQVLLYEASTRKQASYIGSYLKIQQRCGNGPECVWIRGRCVFVSNWGLFTLTGILKRNRFSWDLLDLCTLHWRRTVFHFDDGSIPSLPPLDEAQYQDSSNMNIQESTAVEGHVVQYIAGADVNSPLELKREAALMRTRSYRKGLKQTGARILAVIQSNERLGPISSLGELEEFYCSPLGWNKYHWMRAEGNRLRVPRRDRRVLAHIMALVSSLLVYVQFRDESEGRFGVSVELYGLILANYALVVGYAAEFLVGKMVDVVEAKSERYGIIVTRAIDTGYVRGFHVPNGHWLGYKNGAQWLPWHSITPVEVNATCNSVVFQTESGWRIKALAHNGEIVFPWKATSDENIEINGTNGNGR